MREDPSTPVHAHTGFTFFSARSGFFAVVFISAVLVSIYAAFLVPSVRSITDQTVARYLEIARHVQAEVDAYIGKERRSVRDLALALQFVDGSDRQIELLKQFLSEEHAFSSVRLTDRKGQTAYVASRSKIFVKPGTEIVGKEITEALAGREVTSEVRVSEKSIPFISMAAPIEKNGEIAGAVEAEIDLRPLWDIIFIHTTGKEHSGTSPYSLYVANENGDLVAHSNREYVLQQRNVGARPLVHSVLSERLAKADSSRSSSYLNERGVSAHGVGVPLSSIPWAVFVEAPETTFFESRNFVLQTGAVAALASIILAAFLVRSAHAQSRALTELDAERKHIDAIIANLADALIEYDEGFQIVLLNRTLERMLGIPQRELVGRRLRPEDRDDPRLGVLAQALFKTVDPNASGPQELVVTTPKEMVLEITRVPLKIGGSTTTMLILHDATRERILNRMKYDLVSIAAHQLRTPLTGIKWTLQTILEGKYGNLNSAQTDYLKRGYDSNERMISLVKDLLEAAHIEEGHFTYAFKEGDLPEFLDAVIKDRASQLEARKQKLEFERPTDIPKIFFDPQKLAIAFSNILDNAIKYTKEGGTIGISLLREEPFLKIRIKDTGVGIPKEQRERLFTKFFRAENVMRMQTEGSGLGLFIAKNILTSHGGDVIIDSEENKGTTVTLELPLFKQTAKKVAQPAPEYNNFVQGF